MGTDIEDIKFDGLNPEKNVRLNAFMREVYSSMESRHHGVLVGYAGRPYEHKLPDDVVADEEMLIYLVIVFSSDRGHVTSEIKYNGKTPEYLKITRRIGM